MDGGVGPSNAYKVCTVITHIRHSSYYESFILFYAQGVQNSRSAKRVSKQT